MAEPPARPSRALPEPPASELVDEVFRAARGLHDPALTAGQIVAALEEAVRDLGFARDAQFVADPAQGGAGGTGLLAGPMPAGTGEAELIAVRQRGGPASSALRCVGVAEGAHWPIRLLASHAGAALDARTRSREARKREEALRAISEELQDALLPALPAMASTTIDVVYRAASAEARVGGDFYDAFGLPDGRVLLVVGDVMGKGVKAASHTSRITHTLRALALQGLELNEVLERCHELVSFQDPNLMATVWCALYEPATGELAFTSLGHPPALLLRADGDPITLALEGLPLGMRDLLDEPLDVRRRRLQSRDLLVLYTDGVVEASGDYLAGQKALLAAVESHRDEPLSDVIDAVLDEMLSGGGHRDDALMLLLRRR